VDVHATPEAVAMVRAAGGRLYVWPDRSAGCQPLTVLAAAADAPTGRHCERVPFAPFELYFAAGSGGTAPAELGLHVARGRVRATWDGAAWAI
jgi:hypothetical protein